MAYGDNSGIDGGRPTYTIDQINKGALGDKIVFNSIKDNNELQSVKDERYFVSARNANTDGTKDVWNTGDITVKDGEEYVIRLYVHNNSPKGTDAIAKDVTTKFNLGTVVASTQRVDGFITSSNASITKYWDSVNFKSADGSNFYLDYVEGSAYLENNYFGSISKGNAAKLSDNIVDGGTLIGYNKLDGNLPGCYNYAGYVTIHVKAVFETGSIEKSVRLDGTKEWSNSVNANIGDTVEYQIHYTNNTANTVKNVVISDVLPDGMKFVDGSAKLYNAANKSGIAYDGNAILSNGLNIGGYTVGSDAYIRFKATVVDNKLECGSNRVVNWAKASTIVGTTTNGKTIGYAFATQDNADVNVTKECKETPTPTVTPTTTPTTPKELPKTGAAGIATGVIGLGAVVTTAGYYIASRKQLRK